MKNTKSSIRRIMLIICIGSAIVTLFLLFYKNQETSEVFREISVETIESGDSILFEPAQEAVQEPPISQEDRKGILARAKKSHFSRFCLDEVTDIEHLKTTCDCELVLAEYSRLLEVGEPETANRMTDEILGACCKKLKLECDSIENKPRQGEDSTLKELTMR